MIEVGDKFYNNRGSEFQVIDYKNCDNILVEFNDRFKYQTTVDSHRIKTGIIKNPYLPVIFNIGFFGEGIHKAKLGSANKGAKATKEYATWTNMLSRCYDPNYINIESYRGVLVDSDWHCFQTFADWYIREVSLCKWEGKVNLDKDLLGGGLLYSSSSCSLLPSDINAFITRRKKSDRGCPYLGVSFNASHYHNSKIFYNILETRKVAYTSGEEVYTAYKISKMQIRDQLVAKYKGKIKPETLYILKSKTFEDLFL